MYKSSMNMDWEKCTIGVEHGAKLKEIERRLIAYEVRMDVTARDIREIRDHLLNRPTWITNLLITTIASVLVACIVYILMHK